MQLPFMTYAVWCPLGYVPIEHIAKQVQEWSDQGKVQSNLLKVVLIGNNSVTNPDIVAPMLTSGELRSAGIVTTSGKIVGLSASDWRISDTHGEYHVSAVIAACAGYEISTARPDGRWEKCRPVVTAHDLAIAFDHSDPPPLPAELPPEWKKPVTGSTASKADGVALGWWMRGYAEGFKALNRTPKRDDAIAAATEKLGCTTREAEEAYEALPYPELRNPPRTAKS